jgi:hypothetical protein
MIAWLRPAYHSICRLWSWLVRLAGRRRGQLSRCVLLLLRADVCHVRSIYPYMVHCIAPHARRPSAHSAV